MHHFRILVVDDEAIVALDLQNRLERLGYEVTGLDSSAAGAVRSAEAQKPDLVLMDIHLSGEGDGVAAGTEIRKRMGIPVIFLSGCSDDATIGRSQEADPFGYVIKPVDDRELRVAIEVAMHRHGAETTLKKMERWLTTALRSVGDAVVSTDLSGRVNYFNAVAERLTGTSSEDAIGLEFAQVVDLRAGPGGPPIDSPVLRALGEGVVIDLDPGTVLLRRDTTEIPVENSVAPMRNEAGEVQGVVVVFRDVSALVTTEQKLRMAEDTVRQSLRLESLGRLAGGVAHDFRNLMTAVGGFAELAAREPGLPPHVHDHLNEIRRAAESATALTKQLLAFTRKQSAQPRIIRVNDVVESTRRMLERVVGDDVVVETALDPEAGNVRVDPTQLQQVFVNLTANARAAMPLGGRLQIATRRLREADPPSMLSPAGTPLRNPVLITVSDTGSGMDESTLARLFEPFFTTRADVGGTGLGLSIVHGIVSENGGEIAVSSMPGNGTTFRIWLPGVTGAAGESPPPGAAAVRGSGETVLVVDDNDAIRRLVSSVLEPNGYVVLAASDASEALRRCGEARTGIDLVITNVLMAKGSEPDVVREIHARAPAVPVLYMSGNPGTEHLRRAKSADGSKILQKPFGPTALLSAVREVLAPRRSNQGRSCALPDA